MCANEIERKLADASSGEAVGNRINRTCAGRRRASGQAQTKLRGSGGFGADNFGMRRSCRDSYCDAGDQAAAADRDEHDVGFDFVGDFQSDGALSRDYMGVVVSVNEDRARAFTQVLRGYSRCLIVSSLEHHLLAVASGCVDFGDSRRRRHHDRRVDTGARRGIGQRLAMISRRSGDHTLSRFGWRQRRDPIVSAANFERSGLLEIFELEVNFGVEHPIKGLAAHQRSRLDDPFEAPARLFDFCDTQRHHELPQSQRGRTRRRSGMAMFRNELARGGRSESIAIEIDLLARATLVIEVEERVADRPALHRGDQGCDALAIIGRQRGNFEDLKTAQLD